MSFNSITIHGHLGRDPELTYTPQGAAVCKMSVATTEKYRGKGGEQLERTTWFRVTVWGKPAENASKYLAKGRQVIVIGTLHIEDWTDREGKPRYSVEVNADKVQYINDGSTNNRSEGGHHDQRRSGPDENERSQVRGGAPARSDDALPLNDPDDEIPF